LLRLGDEGLLGKNGIDIIGKISVPLDRLLFERLIPDSA
jgi:hypothetical protein